MVLKYLFLPLLCTIFLCAGSTSGQEPPVKIVDINYLVNMMEGSFSSGESESETGYSDINLHIKKIWGDRSDGKWLYAEQTFLREPGKPYHQRVYRITQNSDRSFESDMFTINNPERFAGEWSKENPLDELTPDSLTLLDGCTLYLSFTGENTFEGSTRSDSCHSDICGAMFTVTETKITLDKIITQDRGYDDNARQVWEAEYVFRKIR